jgi:predicted secreted acid phosphatase
MISWKQILDQHKRDAHKYAIVFDIDQTILRNDAEATCYGKHVEKGKSIYKKAQELNYRIDIITARPHSKDNLNKTREQLHCLGYDKYRTLHLFQTEKFNSVSIYKQTAREWIREQSNILLSVGDQDWDLYSQDEEVEQLSKNTLFKTSSGFALKL